MSTFKINFLDHVAIRVNDIEISAKWYETVLGLKRYQLEAWGPYPIFMLSGKSGVAIFPDQLKEGASTLIDKRVKIDHFAFNVSQDNYEKAKSHLKHLRIAYTEQDHTYFDSIYIQDPDKHTVELTKIKVSEEEFYTHDNEN